MTTVNITTVITPEDQQKSLCTLYISGTQSTYLIMFHYHSQLANNPSYS